MNRFIASIQRDSPLFPLPSPRRGFTLVELLATIVIIGILAGMSLAALSTVQQAARIDRTRATVSKINTYVMEMYESYRGRRLPISNAEMVTYATSAGWSTTSPLTYHRVKLNALRDLMRLEMPDRWNDITDPSNPATVRTASMVLSRVPSLAERYRLRYKRAFDEYGATPTSRHANAKCLYMIVMANNPEAAEHFRSDEVADLDGDGLKCFVDAWGNPIRFIRWPAGFVNYDNLTTHNGGTVPAGAKDGKQIPWGAPSDLQTGDASSHPDPWDPYKVMSKLVDNGTLVENRRGYFMAPLIYSAGPDGVFDINLGTANGGADVYQVDRTPEGDINPFGPDGNTAPDLAGGTVRFTGQPLDEGNGELEHYDNITNHGNEVK